MYFSEILNLSVSLLLLLVAARGAGALFAALNQPRVIGEIVGGLLLGPTLVGWAATDASAWLFPKSGLVTSALSIVSQVGLVLLMYASGTQLRSFVGAGEKRVVAALSLAGTLLPLVAGLVYAQFADMDQLMGTAQNSTALVLVFATAIAIASIPVISRIMLDLGIMETSFARIVIATAVIDDLALYVILAVALGLVSTGGNPHGLASLLALEPGSPWVPVVHVAATVGLICGTLLVGPFVLRVLVRQIQRLAGAKASVAAHTIFLTMVSGGCFWLGVNPMFGGLTAGLVAGRVLRQLSSAMPRSLELAGLKFFVPVYFALVGARLDLIHHFDAAYFLVFLAFACVVKGLSIYAGARAAGESPSAAANLAAALNARGGPGIVLAAVTYDAGIINESFFTILVLTAVVTSLAAGSWLGRVAHRGASLRDEGHGRSKLALRGSA